VNQNKAINGSCSKIKIYDSVSVRNKVLVSENNKLCKMEQKVDPTVISAELWATGDAHKCGNCSKKFPNGKNLVAHLSSEHDMSKKNHDLVYGVSKSTLRTFQCKVVLNGDVTCPTTFNHTYNNIKSHLMDFHQMSLVDYFKEHVLNFRKKGVTTPEVESPMRVEDSPREPRKRKHENKSSQPEQTVPKKKRLKTTNESEEKKGSHHQRYKQVKLRINNNGQESYVALDDFKRKKAEKEGSNQENAEPTIKDKSPLQRKSKAETVKPSPQSQKKKLLEENGARTEGGKSDSVRTSGKKEKQTKIISFTDSRKPVHDEENSVQEKMPDKCIFQCTICQPFRLFNEVEEFKSHLKKEHKTSFKKFASRVGFSAVRQLKVMECKHCQKVLVQDQGVIESHLKECS